MNTNEGEVIGNPPADIETSTDGYALRFKGAVGQWMLDRQARLGIKLLRAERSLSLVDVGGGHGQLARPLAAAGHHVTVLGSAPACVHRIADLVETGQVEFISGNVLELPFEDNSFDASVCFRLVTHCEQWSLLISELCRVARDAVIVDYPTIQSANIISSALFGMKRKIEGDTRQWTLFWHKQIDEAFAAAGWRVVARRKQYFMPMVLYRVLRSRFVAEMMESCFAAVGLTGLFGSPVIVRAEPL